MFNYYGGKWNVAPEIIKWMPQHEVYVEAFGGSLSVFLQKKPCNLEVVNDAEERIVNCYRMVRDRHRDMRLLLEMTPYSRKERFGGLDRHVDPIEDARRTFAALWFGVGHSLADKSAGFRNSKTSNCSPASSFKNWCDELPDIHGRLRDALVECLDWRLIFDKYDTPETLWYLDPPYLMSTRKDPSHGYTHEFTDADHSALLERVQTLKGWVLLSGYKEARYDALGWHRDDFAARAQHGATTTESLWISPRTYDTVTRQLSLF